VDVEGSNPFSRSEIVRVFQVAPRGGFLFGQSSCPKDDTFETLSTAASGTARMLAASTSADGPSGRWPPDTVCAIPDSAYTAKPPSPPAAPAETKPSATTNTELPVFANAFVYNPFDRRIYASVPGTQGVSGNSIAVINPALEKVEKFIPIGSEPSALALSDDGKVLWLFNSGSGSLRKLDLKTYTAGKELPIGTNRLVSDAVDLRVLSGTHDSVLLSALSHVTVYDSGVPRAHSATSFTAELVTTGSASLAYGYNGGSSAFNLMTLCLNGNGVFIALDEPEIFAGYSINLELRDGILYASNGAYDVRAHWVLGRFATGGGLVAADPGTRRVFFLSWAHAEHRAWSGIRPLRVWRGRVARVCARELRFLLAPKRRGVFRVAGRCASALFVRQRVRRGHRRDPLRKRGSLLSA
jgi:hypothetical protein